MFVVCPGRDDHVEPSGRSQMACSLHPPPLTKSAVKLQFKGGRLVGTFSALLIYPQVGGTCGSTSAFDGTIDLASDGPGYRGLATGTHTLVGNGRATCPGDQTTPGCYWDVTVSRPRSGANSIECMLGDAEAVYRC